jgi:hypothetical protein
MMDMAAAPRSRLGLPGALLFVLTHALVASARDAGAAERMPRDPERSKNSTGRHWSSRGRPLQRIFSFDSRADNVRRP